MLRGKGGRHKRRVRPFGPRPRSPKSAKLPGTSDAAVKDFLRVPCAAPKLPSAPPRNFSAWVERRPGFLLAAEAPQGPGAAQVSGPPTGTAREDGVVLAERGARHRPARPRPWPIPGDIRAPGHRPRGPRVSLFGAGRGRHHAPGPDRGRATLRRRWCRGAPLLRDAAAPTRPRPNERRAYPLRVVRGDRRARSPPRDRTSRGLCRIGGRARKRGRAR